MNGFSLYSLSQLKPSFLSKCDRGHTALLTQTGEGFWFCWKNILFLMAQGEVEEKLHMMKDITNHIKQGCSVVITRVSLVEVPDASVLERQGTVPAQGAKNIEEATM